VEPTNFDSYMQSTDDEIINVVKDKRNRLKKINIILYGMPFRFDLPQLHDKISQTNINLKMSIKYSNVSYIGYDNFDRSCYTTHFNFK
jgi:hypothetical protein